MNKKDAEMLMIGLGSGFLIGSLIALFLTPSSGKKLRMRMTDMMDGLTGRINRFVEPDKYSRFKP